MNVSNCPFCDDVCLVDSQAYFPSVNRSQVHCTACGYRAPYVGWKNKVAFPQARKEPEEVAILMHNELVRRLKLHALRINIKGLPMPIITIKQNFS